MKLLSFFLILLALTATEIPNAYGSCPGKCTGTSWNNGVTYYNGSACALKIFYKYRECNCPGVNCTREIVLERFDEMSGGDCSEYTSAEMQNMALRQLLWFSLNIFNISDPSSGWDIEVNMEPCWSENSGTWTSSSCNNTSCCSGTYSLDLVGGIVEATDVDLSQDNTTCSGPGGIDCFNHCASRTITLDDNVLGTYQPPFCDTSCQTQWIVNPLNFETFDVDICMSPEVNCDFKVFFANRTCNNLVQFCPYRIEQIGTCSCNWQSTHSIWREIFNYAVRACLKNLATGGDLPQDYVIQNPECWEVSENIIIPCGYDDCCSRTYTVDENQQHDLKVTDQSSTSGNDGCSTYGCSATCDDLYVDEVLPLGKMTYPLQPIITSLNKESSWVVPNPSDGMVNIHFLSDVSGDFDLEIYDYQGNLIMHKAKKKNSAEISWQINCKKMASGIYFYRIRVDNKIISSGKYILNR